MVLATTQMAKVISSGGATLHIWGVDGLQPSPQRMAEGTTFTVNEVHDIGGKKFLHVGEDYPTEMDVYIDIQETIPTTVHPY